MMAMFVGSFVFFACMTGSLTTAFVVGPALTPPFGVQRSRCSPLYASVATPQVASKYFQLQEMEDGDSATTEIFLKENGQVDFFESDGPLALSCEGDWAQSGDDFTMIVTRLFEAGHEETSHTDMGEFHFEVERTLKGRVTNVGIATAVEGTIHDVDDLFGDRKIGYFQMIDTTEERLKYHGEHVEGATNGVAAAAVDANGVAENNVEKVTTEAAGLTNGSSQKNGHVVNGKSDPFADVDLGGGGPNIVNGIDVSTPLAKPTFPNPFGNKDQPKVANGNADPFASNKPYVPEQSIYGGAQEPSFADASAPGPFATKNGELQGRNGHMNGAQSNSVTKPELANGHSVVNDKLSKQRFGSYLDEIEKNALREPKIAGGHIVDEEKRLEQSEFPIKPEDLIDLAKNVLRVSGGLDDESLLADDFEFYVASNGPFSKEVYLGRHSSSEVSQAFPDFDNNYYNFHVDPFEFDRVWYNVRPTATHTGSWKGRKATGKRLQLPPQAQSMIFNEEGKVKVMTVGYVMDNRIGNTGGMGGTYGLLSGIDAIDEA